MRSSGVVAIWVATLWLAPSGNRVMAQSSAQQAPKKPASAQSVALTPREKEAQKHYRIALVAIKNNDFSTASDELKAASELAPKNALIWYNLAVVESKKGDSAPALEHLQKAETLGLPKTLQTDADQLEAKLAYDVKRKVKLDAFSAKLLDLSKQVAAAANFNCSDPFRAKGNPFAGETEDWGSDRWSYDLRLSDSPHKVTLLSSHYYSLAKGTKPGTKWSNVLEVTFDPAELDPNIGGGNRVTACHEPNTGYNVPMMESVIDIKPRNPAAIQCTGTFEQEFPVEDKKKVPCSWGSGTVIEIEFHSSDEARATADKLSELIRMSADIQ